MSGQAQEQKGSVLSEPVLLSELVLSGSEHERLVGAEVTLPDGSLYGRIEDLFFARDLTVSHAVVKRQDGLSVKIPAERLVLVEDRLVLLKPRQLFINEAARLVLKAAEQLVEVLSVKEPAMRQFLIEAARRNLELALKSLEGREVEL
jgi:sporulation protein YlmC with PRC-barrel domain